MGGAVLLLLAALVLVWRFTPLRDYATAESAVGFFQTYRHHPLAAIYTILVYILGGLVAFPVTVMIVATTAAFGLWPGALHAALGSLASAGVGYWVGHVIGAARIGRHFGPRAEKIKNNIDEHGIMAIMTIRIVPIAPFSIINVVAGALNINFTHYMLGTVLGLAPGFIVLAFAGDQVSSFMAHPSLSGAAMLGLILLVWLALSLVLQSALRRRTKV